MKVLFLGSQNIIGNIKNGGMQCSKRNYELLKSVVGEENVYSALVYNSKEIAYHNRFFKRNENSVQSLIASFAMCRLYGVSEEKKIISYINEISPDILFVDTSSFGKIVKKIDAKIKTVVFLHNVESDYAWNRVLHGGIQFLPVYFASFYNEQVGVKKADKVICLNKRDAERVAKKYGRKVTQYLPISFEDQFEEGKKRRGNRKELLFVGSNFPPNLDGVRWFVEEVMPQLSDFKLYVVGKDFENVRGELERKNVQVIGTVENVREYYNRFSAIVMPILYGDGMKVKTAEAMMYGMDIFASNEALEGYEVEGVEGIYRCNTKEEFVSKIRNYAKQGQKEMWNQSVRQLFLEKYEVKKQKEIMERIISEW